MEETGENPLWGPAIKSLEGKITYPYQEQRERWGTTKFNVIMVFGQGPVKPVLLLDELTSEEQKQQWDEFKKDPLHSKEPDFRVVEEEVYTSILDGIDKRTDLNNEEKRRLKELKRQEWQNLGRFALNRWGRQNALAAGLALYLGLTDKIILTGGKTIPDWAKERLPTERQNNWPSEAELMKDIIVRRFGDLYLKKFGRPIEEAIEIEDRSTNTLENFAYSINNNPSLISADKNIGLLGADFHVRRIALLANLFSVFETADGRISAQQILRQRARHKSYREIIEYMTDALGNSDLQERLLREERWESGLIKPEYLTYWLGYIGLVESPAVIQRVVKCLSNPRWIEAARKAFSSVGLDFDEISVEDLILLQQKDPDKYNDLRTKLAGLRTAERRKMPPKI